MEAEKMKQNSVKAPNYEAFEPVASTTMPKIVFMKYEELSSDKPICGTFPLVDSPESEFSLIGTVLSVISELISVLLLLFVFAARLLTVSLRATSNWIEKTMEKLNDKGKGRESDANRGKTTKFLEASSSGKDKETRQSNSLVRRNKEINNPNQHANYNEDHDTYPNNPRETANCLDHGYTVENCFNNVGGGTQDYSYCRIKSCTSKDAYNNLASGLQALSGANVSTSRIEDAFNNESSHSQTYRGAEIGNPKTAIRHGFNNEKGGTQNYDGIIWGEIEMNT